MPHGDGRFPFGIALAGLLEKMQGTRCHGSDDDLVVQIRVVPHGLDEPVVGVEQLLGFLCGELAGVGE